MGGTDPQAARWTDAWGAQGEAQVGLPGSRVRPSGGAGTQAES